MPILAISILTKECSMELGKTISEIRKNHKLTQEEFAKHFHVTRQTISNWETGKSYPDLETLVQISEDFHISLDTMMKGDTNMVRKITREQKHGKNHKLKISLAIASVLAVIVSLFLILDNTVTTLKPEDYTISVKKITLDNVTVDDVNKIAVYNDPEGGEYLNEDESKDDGSPRKMPEQGAYVFEGEEYASLMSSGCAYELIVTSDQYIDGYYVDSDGKGSLSVEVWRSNTWFLDDSKQNRAMIVWFDDFDKIYDSNTNDIVWEEMI